MRMPSAAPLVSTSPPTPVPSGVSRAEQGRSDGPPDPTQAEFEAWMTAVAMRADRQAFAALFKHFAPRVKSFLLRSGTGPELAEELAQETMVALWRKARLFDPQRAAVSTWIFRIARNLRIDHHRRTRGGTEPQVEDRDQWENQQPLFAAAAPQPQDALAAVQRERVVRDAVARLPEHQALVLRLSFFEDHAHGRIAQELGIPLGTVKSRIRLAVTQLRRAIDEQAT